jgi:hypothetical protein
MTLGQLIIIIIAAGLWPFALSQLATFASALVPPAASSQAYTTAMQILKFINDNAPVLSAVSIIVTAILVRWRV